MFSWVQFITLFVVPLCFGKLTQESIAIPFSVYSRLLSLTIVSTLFLHGLCHLCHSVLRVCAWACVCLYVCVRTCVCWPIEIISEQCSCCHGNAGFCVSFFLSVSPPIAFPLHARVGSRDCADVKPKRRARESVNVYVCARARVCFNKPACCNEEYLDVGVSLSFSYPVSFSF